MVALVPFLAFGQQSGGLPALREEVVQEAITRATADAREVALRKDADVALQAQIQTVQGSVSSGLNTESTARVTADTALQNGLNAEAAARVAGDAQLTTSLNSEIAARQGADNSLQATINAESAARAAGDAQVTTNLNSEIAARQAADAVETAARIQGDANTLTAARAYADTRAGPQVVRGTVNRDGGWIAGENWWSYSQIRFEGFFQYAILLQTMTNPDAPPPQCAVQLRWTPTSDSVLPPLVAMTFISWAGNDTPYQSWQLYVSIAGPRTGDRTNPYDQQAMRSDFDFICFQ
jgi:hypothetical protein